MSHRAIAAALLALAVAARDAAAQQAAPSIKPVFRADAIIARESSLQLGAGLDVPIGYYVRVEALAAAGPAFGRATGASVRGDLVARYQLDPFLEHSVGLYGGGGLSARYDPGLHWRGLLVLVVGAEGKARGPVVPFVELGYGGGTRIGVGVRRGTKSFR